MTTHIITEAEFDNSAGWGLWAGIDLNDCELEIITDAQKIKDYVYELCNRIGMKRYGDCVVVNFGEDPRVAGFSMTQLIETSLISGHFVNQNRNVYIDVFSCKFFNAEVAADFTRSYFGATNHTVQTALRR